MNHKDKEILKRRFDSLEQEVDINKLMSEIDKKRGRKPKRRIIFWLLYPSLLLITVAALRISGIIKGSSDSVEKTELLGALNNKNETKKKSKKEGKLQKPFENSLSKIDANQSKSENILPKNKAKKNKLTNVNETNVEGLNLSNNNKNKLRPITEKVDNSFKEINSKELILENSSTGLDEGQSLVLHPILSDPLESNEESNEERQKESKGLNREQIEKEIQDKIQQEPNRHKTLNDLLAMPILFSKLNTEQFKMPTLNFEELKSSKSISDFNEPIRAIVKARMNYGKYIGTFSGSESKDNSDYELSIINHSAETQEFLAGVSFSNRFSIFTGITRMQLIERMDFNASYLVDQNGALVGYISEEQTVINYLTAIEGNPDLQKTDWSFRNYNSYSSLAIPFEVSYRLTDKKMSMNLLAGFRIPLNNKYRGYVMQKNQLPLEFEEIISTSAKLNLFAGLELDYRLTEKITIGLGIQGSYYRLLQNEEEHKIYMYSGALSVGYSL